MKTRSPEAVNPACRQGTAQFQEVPFTDYLVNGILQSCAKHRPGLLHSTSVPGLD